MKIRRSLLTVTVGLLVAIAGAAVPVRAALSAAAPVAKISSSTPVLAGSDGQDPWPRP